MCPRPGAAGRRTEEIKSPILNFLASSRWFSNTGCDEFTPAGDARHSNMYHSTSTISTFTLRKREICNCGIGAFISNATADYPQDAIRLRASYGCRHDTRAHGPPVPAAPGVGRRLHRIPARSSCNRGAKQGLTRGRCLLRQDLVPVRQSRWRKAPTSPLLRTRSFLIGRMPSWESVSNFSMYSTIRISAFRTCAP